MKKLLIFSVALVCLYSNAQNINDVTRYSLENLQGTARYQALGGAFGALGGDLSALNANPAGSAVFKFSQIGITGTNYHRNNDAFYGNNRQNVTLNSLEFNQAGGVFVYDTGNRGWNRFALAFNYDLARNFDNEFAANDSFIEDGYSINQNYYQITEGFNQKFTVNFAGNYEDNFYFGTSLNFHSTAFEKFANLDEDGINDTENDSYVANLRDRLYTEGTGFSFALGGILKLNHNLRVGASYQSPIWWTRMLDTYSAGWTENGTIINDLDYNIINIYDSYRIKTPAKLTGSAAIVFGKDGLLSFDYGYQDFSQAELGPNGIPEFVDENAFISNQLKEVNSYRLGGEYRIKDVSLRAGYRFEESPYVDEETIGDLTGYSGGIGISFKGKSRLDFALSRTEQEVFEPLLGGDFGLSNEALVDRTNTNATLTYVINF